MPLLLLLLLPGGVPGAGPLVAQPILGEPVARSVTLDLVAVPLPDALEAVARESGALLAYPTRDLHEGNAVSLRLRRTPPGTAVSALIRERTPRPEGRRTAREGERVTAGTIHGRVIDAGSGAPLATVEVRILGSERRTLTDEEGRYRLEGVSAGRQDVEARRIGYRAAQVSVEVTEEGVHEIDLSLDPEAILMDQLVVAGSMIPVELRSVPTPVTVITAEDIERLNPTNFADVIRAMVPGANVPDQGALTPIAEISFRGSASLRGPIGSPPKIYVDGVPASPMQGATHIDPNIIERIEVLRGPQAAAIYGPDAITGVIQIFTRRVRGSGVRLAARAKEGVTRGMFGESPALTQEYSGRIEAGGERTNIRIAPLYQHEGAWVPNGGMKRTGASLTAGVEIVGATLTSDLSWMKTQHYDAGNQILSPYPLFSSIMGKTVLHWEGLAVAMSLNRPMGRHTSLSSSYTYSRGEQMVAYRPEEDGSVRASESPSITDDRTVSLSVAHDRSERNSPIRTVVFGIDAQKVSPRYRESDSRNMGGFTQVAVVPFDSGPTVTGGLRYDHTSAFDGHRTEGWNPKVGLAYPVNRLGAEWKLRAAYGSAMRPPRAGQGIGRMVGSAEYLENPSLRATVQRGLDAGVDMVAETGMELTLTFFEQDVFDAIETVRLPLPETPNRFQEQNVGRLRNRGVEGSIAHSVGGIRWSANGAWVHSVLRDMAEGYSGSAEVGERVDGVPTATLGLEVEAELSRGVRVGARAEGAFGVMGMNMAGYYHDLLIENVPDLRSEDYRTELTSPFLTQLYAHGRINSSVWWRLDLSNLTDTKGHGAMTGGYPVPRRVSLTVSWEGGGR